MVEILDDETIFMRETEKLIGSETAAAERKRRQRAAENTANPLPLSSNCDNVTQASQNSHIDIELDKDKDIDIDIELDKEKKKRARFVPPTVEEIRIYIDENNYQVDAEQFFDYYASKNWTVGRSKMADWRAAVRNWQRRNNEFGRTQKPPRRDHDAGDNVFLKMIEGGEP